MIFLEMVTVVALILAVYLLVTSWKNKEKPKIWLWALLAVSIIGIAVLPGLDTSSRRADSASLQDTSSASSQWE